MLAYESKVPATYRTKFIQKVREISQRLGINPDWLMIVMKFETAGTFRADIRNGSAVGLIQFTPTGIDKLGVSLASLATMSAVDQLNYVEKYLRIHGKGRMNDVFDVYITVFAPATLGKPDSQVMYRSPSKQYTANKAMDVNGDGVITVGDVKAQIRKHVPSSVVQAVPVEPSYDPAVRTTPSGITFIPFTALVAFTILLVKYGPQINFRVGSAE
jgi:hypothetical protein